MEKIFNIVATRVEESLNSQGFEKQNQTDKNMALFINGNIAYSVMFNEEKKQFELKTCTLWQNNDEDSWKNVSSWMFDPIEGTQRDAECIATDFEETLRGPKKVSTVQNPKQKKDSDNTVDIIFFMNRLSNIFPNLKDDIKIEKENYQTFRTVKFIEEKVVPEIHLFLNQIKNDKSLKKFCNILSDAYSAGNLDVRSSITILILNSIDNESQIKEIEHEISEDLKKAWKSSIKLKGKNIKPEKLKKKKSFITNTLEKK